MARTRRGRPPTSYARRAPEREPYDLVLIVCEGEKTEPYYFEGLKRAWRLSNANIRVRSAGASDPLSLVKFALAEMRSGDDYDRAFCVFDKDTHASFGQALQQISQSPEGRRGRLKEIVSWPCFEIWVLLHFIQTTRAFPACEQVIREIAKYYGEYAKGMRNVFDALADKIDVAIANADHLENHNRNTKSYNPATAIHALIKYLRGLKRL
jgi:hypothetical protein